MTDTADRPAGLGREVPGRPEVTDPDLGVASDRGRTARGLAVLSAGAFALLAARPLVDNSFLTHLATGRIIVGSGFPTTNPFLYSSSDFPMPNWLWSVVLGLVDRLAGGVGLRLLTAVIAAVLAVVVVRLTRPDDEVVPAPTLLSAVVPTACVLLTLMPFLNARPQLPGYLLLAVTVLVVKERRSPWWLVGVFALWVDVHGTWTYGLVVLALLLTVQAIDDRRLRWSQVGGLAAGCVGVVLGGALGPEPFRVIALPFEQFGDDRARAAISAYAEWKPAGWGHPLTWVLIAMGVVAVLGAVRSRRRGMLVGSVAMVVAGMSAGRLLPLAAITLVPWMAIGVAVLAGAGSRPLPLPQGSRRLAVAGVLLGVVATVWIVATPAYDLSSYPVAAVDWLQERGLAGSPAVKVAAPDYVGNYLDWRFGDRADTFVDDRAGVDAALDYRMLKHVSPGWRQALERTDADVVVWPSEWKLVDHLDPPEWRRVGEFGDVSVFCRSSIADRCS